MPLTHKESKYIAARINGKTEKDALIAAGFSKWIAHTPGQLAGIEKMRAEVEKYTAELVANTIEEGLIDATEIHEYLSEALRARISDIQNDDFTFKPLNEWPDIWQRMYEAGDVSVEKLYDRSNDGATKDKRGGWDETGTVTQIKLKFSSRVKMLELAMKHRGVNAMVQEKTGDTHIHLHAEITAKLQSALARKSQLPEARNVTP